MCWTFRFHITTLRMWYNCPSKCPYVVLMSFHLGFWIFEVTLNKCTLIFSFFWGFWAGLYGTGKIYSVYKLYHIPSTLKLQQWTMFEFQHINSTKLRLIEGIEFTLISFLVVWEHRFKRHQYIPYLCTKQLYYVYP